MRLLFAPTLGFAPVFGRIGHPDHSLTLIAKCAVALVPEGTCTLQGGALAQLSGDIPYADAQGAPRYEGDFVHFKGQADVLVVGHYVAPHERAVRADEVRVEVGSRTARLAVVGERIWPGAGPLPDARAAQPFTRLELRWEHAFGGPECADNHVGLGHVPLPPAPDPQSPQAHPRPAPMRLPRLERTDRPYLRTDRPPEPLCFAPTARTWPGRQKLAGTYDARWERTRWPWYAEDCKPEFFQAAARELRVQDYLHGDEKLRVTNMHAQHSTYATRLPGLRVVAAIQRQQGWEPVPMQLDTLWIDMDAERACLVWRGVCKVADARGSDVLHAWADLQPLSAASTPDAIRTRAEQARLDDEAQWLWLPHEPEPKPPPPPLAAEAEAEPEPEPEWSGLPAHVVLPKPSAEQEALFAQQRAAAEAEREAQLDAAEAAAAAEAHAANPAWTRERVRAAHRAGDSLAGLDLTGIDLSGEDLAACDLSGTILRDAKLDATILRGARLRGASFEGASLDGADLTGADLTDAVLARSHGSKILARDATFEAADLRECDWPDAGFEAAMLPLANGTGARCPRANFARAQLAEATFDDAQLTEARFEGADAKSATFVRAQLARSVWTGTDLGAADLSGADLTGARIERCQLRDVLLENARLNEAVLKACDVTKLRAEGAELAKAQLIEVHGEQVILAGAKLAEARIEACRWPRADLSGSELRSARLRGCDLRGAKLAEANLSFAWLLGCDFFEASFEQALLHECDGSGSSFFGSEFRDAHTASFHGRGRDLERTKLVSAGADT